MTASAARQRILDTVTALFPRQGIDGAGIDPAVAQSGVARMAPCRHFRAKEELAMAFLETVNSDTR